MLIQLMWPSLTVGIALVNYVFHLFSLSAVDGIITSSVEDVVNAICQEDFKVGSSEKDNTIESSAGVSMKENTVESNDLIM